MSYENAREGDVMTKEQWANVQELADRKEGLSARECDFVSDLMERGSEYELSDRQVKCLERIVNK